MRLEYMVALFAWGSKRNRICTETKALKLRKNKIPTTPTLFLYVCNLESADSCVENPNLELEVQLIHSLHYCRMQDVPSSLCIYSRVVRVRWRLVIFTRLEVVVRNMISVISESKFRYCCRGSGSSVLVTLEILCMLILTLVLVFLRLSFTFMLMVHFFCGRLLRKEKEMWWWKIYGKLRNFSSRWLLFTLLLMVLVQIGVTCLFALKTQKWTPMVSDNAIHEFRHKTILVTGY